MNKKKWICLSLSLGGAGNAFLWNFIIMFQLLYFGRITIYENNLFILIVGDMIFTMICVFCFIYFYYDYLKLNLEIEIQNNHL